MNLSEYMATTTQTEFADSLGVSQGLVSQWLSGETRITPEKAMAIEIATNGLVKKQELRPDIWPELIAA